MENNNKRSFIERLNARLQEPAGATFRDGKWRFWFPLAVFLGIANAMLTGTIFAGNDQFQSYMGGMILAVATMLGWIGVGALHYTDSPDALLARGLSMLDSGTLFFVIAHFCFLMWAQGHLLTIRSAEAAYKADARTYNQDAQKVSDDNVKIAEAAARIAQDTAKAERLRNDTVYQQRRAAQLGVRFNAPPRAQAPGVAPSLSTSSVELEKPEKPKQSSAAFLMKWDGLIRLASFGELILAAITLVYIRNRSAKFNAQFFPSVHPPMSPTGTDGLGGTRGKA